MARNNGARYEAELKKLLTSKGEVVLDMGREETCDLFVASKNILIEVKSTSRKVKYFSQREKEQFRRLKEIQDKIIEPLIYYAIRFSGSAGKKPVWRMHSLYSLEAMKFVVHREKGGDNEL